MHIIIIIISYNYKYNFLINIKFIKNSEKLIYAANIITCLLREVLHAA